MGDIKGDDHADLARLRDGDADAFDALFTRHVDGARRVARSMLRDAAAAEDAVAEAFAQTYAAIQRGRGPVDGFDAYIRRSVRHQCLRTWRRQDRQPPVAAAAVATRLGPVSDGADERVDEEILRSAFRDLPSKMRLVLWRTEVGGRSHADVADQIQASPAAVVALAMRARRELARQYLDRHVAATSRLAPACADVRRELAAIVRDAAGDSRRAQVEAHLAICPGCSDARQGLERVNARLRTAPLGVLLEVYARSPLAALIPRLGALVSAAGGLVPAAGLILALAVVASGDGPAAAEPASDDGRLVSVVVEGPLSGPGLRPGGVGGGTDPTAGRLDPVPASVPPDPPSPAATAVTTVTTVAPARPSSPVDALTLNGDTPVAMLVAALELPEGLESAVGALPAQLPPPVDDLAAAVPPVVDDVVTGVVDAAEVATVVAQPVVAVVTVPPSVVTVPRPPVDPPAITTTGPLATVAAAVPTLVPAPVCPRSCRGRRSCPVSPTADATPARGEAARNFFVARCHDRAAGDF